MAIDMRLVDLDRWRSMPNENKQRVAKAIAANVKATSPADPHAWDMTYTHLISNVDCPQDFGYENGTIIKFLAEGDTLQIPSRRERSLFSQNVV